MPYRLTQKNNFQDGIHRIAVEQIDKILIQLQDKSLDQDKVVHDVRKRFKKLRAVLRLVRDGLGEKTYKKLNVTFRDLARRIAPVRDSKVLLNTLETLRDENTDPIIDSLKKELEDQHENYKKEILSEKDELSKIEREVNNFQPPVDHWEISDDDFKSIEPGLKRVYKRGVKALAKLQKNPDSSDFHEFRKRVKYLWYHIRILRDLWKNQLKPYAQSLHNLSDYLGDDHDLFVLSRHLKNMDSLKEEDLELLIQKISAKRVDLQRKSIDLAKLVYAETPSKFVSRIKKYWKNSEI